MQKNTLIHKIAQASLALFISASPIANAMDLPLREEENGSSSKLRDHGYYRQALQKLEESTCRIHEEVDRILREFRKNMEEYRLHTRGTSPVIMTPIVLADIQSSSINNVEKLVRDPAGEKKDPTVAVETQKAGGRKVEDKSPPQRNDASLSGPVKHEQLSDEVHKRIPDEKSLLQFMSVPDAIRSEVQSLNLFGSDVTDNGLKQLDKLPNLKFLNLNMCQKITNNGLEQLVKLPNLKILGLCGCEGLTDDPVKILVNKSNLEVFGNKYRMGRYGNFPPIGYMTKVTVDDNLLEIQQNPSEYDVMFLKMPDHSKPERLFIYVEGTFAGPHLIN